MFDMKKRYNSPLSNVRTIKAARFFAASTLDPNSDNPVVTPGDDPYNDEFGSPRPHNLWDEENKKNKGN